MSTAAALGVLDSVAEISLGQTLPGNMIVVRRTVNAERIADGRAYHLESPPGVFVSVKDVPFGGIDNQTTLNFITSGSERYVSEAFQDVSDCCRRWCWSLEPNT